MPYVKVWVDDECDGKCESAEEADKLQNKIDEAVSLLRSGYSDAALHALTDDVALPFKSPNEIKAKYALWRSGKLPGFVPPNQA